MVSGGKMSNWRLESAFRDRYICEKYTFRTVAAPFRAEETSIQPGFLPIAPLNPN